jgi:hypothetical protein
VERITPNFEVTVTSHITRSEIPVIHFSLYSIVIPLLGLLSSKPRLGRRLAQFLTYMRDYAVSHDFQETGCDENVN